MFSSHVITLQITRIYLSSGTESMIWQVTMLPYIAYLIKLSIPIVPFIKSDHFHILKWELQQKLYSLRKLVQYKAKSGSSQNIIGSGWSTSQKMTSLIMRLTIYLDFLSFMFS